MFESFKHLADRKKNIYDEDLTALVADDVFDMPVRYELVSVEFRSGTELAAVGARDGARSTAKSTSARPTATARSTP